MIWRPATYPLMDGRNFVVRSGPGKGLAAGDAIGLLERHMMQMTSPPRLDPTWTTCPCRLSRCGGWYRAGQA